MLGAFRCFQHSKYLTLHPTISIPPPKSANSGCAYCNGRYHIECLGTRDCTWFQEETCGKRLGSGSCQTQTQIRVTYADYTSEDAKILSTLHSGFDDINALFKRWNLESYIPSSMLANEKAKDLLKQSGPSLWPGQNGKAPAFIDPHFRLDFSMETTKKGIQSG